MSVGTGDQQMFENMLQAIQTNQQLKLGQRQQNLAERQFKEGLKEVDLSRKAIEKLAGYTSENIHKAPADVLATINKASLGGMFSTNNSIRAGQTPTGSNVPADIQVLNVMQEQAKQFGGDITKTDMWKIKTSGKNKEKSRSDIVLELAKARANDYVFQALSPEEQRKRLEADAEFIIDPDKITGAKRTGNLLLDKTIESFMDNKKSEIINTLMPASHEAVVK